MKSKYLVITLILGLYACESRQKSTSSGDHNTLVESSSPFRTTDSSKLFFKNVRQIYYDCEELEASKLKICRLKALEEAPFRFQITENWRFDEAYLILEPGSPLQVWNAKGDTVQFESGNKEAHLDFAQKLLPMVSGSEQLGFRINGNTDALSAKVKDGLRVTIKDYLRLTE